MINNITSIFLDADKKAISDYKGICFSSVFWKGIPKGTKYFIYSPSLDPFVDEKTLPDFYKFVKIHFPFFNEAEVSDNGKTIVVPWNKFMTQTKAFAILTLMRYPAELYYEIVLPVIKAPFNEKMKTFLDCHETPGKGPNGQGRDYLGYAHTIFDGDYFYKKWKNKNFFFNKKVEDFLNKKGSKDSQALHTAFEKGIYEISAEKEKEDDKAT